ncbi:WD domain-containing protein [Penicillium paradoxum]|uniref:WD domain-containing protein n=1 Tax=Penicillium paradoxum TaxID=176176 RepID=UPI0025480C20|nr:WD domain-containing protein [Penicillium paradoxum]KAJ5773685.1 WD domain-containing protein [Penicillium paradoxum]
MVRKVLLDHWKSGNWTHASFKNGLVVHVFKTWLRLYTLSFSGNRQYLKFDRGKVPLRSQDSPVTSMSHRSLWVGGGWIFQQGRKLISSPPVVRGCHVTVNNGTIWLYQKSGLISVLEIDLDATLLAAENLPERETHFDVLLNVNFNEPRDAEVEKVFTLT